MNTTELTTRDVPHIMATHTPAASTNNDEAKLSRYILIAGRGRSGTNFLLELLNLSPLTHARNEPNKLVGSSLSRLPGHLTLGPTDHAALEEGWDRAILEASRSMGERDHLPTTFKQHLRPIPRRLGFYKLLDGPRTRRVLRVFMPSVRGAEWPIPPWISDRNKLAHALPILKINHSPGWMQWVLANRPEARVLHIARHPGGFLNSWRNRWLTLQDRQIVRKKNLIRLKRIADVLPEWAQRFGDIDGMSVEESELWFWCYTNEVIYQAGFASPNYMLVIYERLSGHSLEITKQAYAFCGLPWTNDIVESTRTLSNDSPSISNSWQEKLSREHIELVNRILAESSINQWWQ